MKRLILILFFLILLIKPDTEHPMPQKMKFMMFRYEVTLKDSMKFIIYPGKSVYDTWDGKLWEE